MSITCQCGDKMACVDTRTVEGMTRRRYHCRTCSARLKTTETIDDVESQDYQRGVAAGESRAMRALRMFIHAVDGKDLLS